MSTAYNSAYQPAFPALMVILRAENTYTEPISAILDTGADITFIPTDLLEQVEAAESQSVRVRSHFGESHAVQLYLIRIDIEGLSLPGVYVVGDDTGSEIILGRDVLNKLPVFLDGPAENSEVLDAPSASRLRARR